MTEAKTKTVAGETVAPRPTLVERLIAVKADIGGVGKDGRNAQQGFNFRGIDAVMNAVAGPLIKHGIMAIPVKVISVKRATASTTGGKLMNTVEVVMRYAFTDGVDTLEFEAPGEAFDSGDKSTAKAMSVALRTALLQALSLPTDDPDPDHDYYAAQQIAAQISDEEVLEKIKKVVDVSELQDLWREQRVGGRPAAVQEAFKAKAALMQGQASA